MRRGSGYVAVMAVALASGAAACTEPHAAASVGLAFTTRPAPAGPLGGAMSVHGVQSDTAVINRRFHHHHQRRDRAA